MIVKREENDRYSLRMNVHTNELYRNFSVVAEDKVNLTVFVAYKKAVYKKHYNNQRQALEKCEYIFAGMNDLLAGLTA